MDAFRTSDMTLVAYLNIEGFTHDSQELIDQKQCLWVFEPTAEMLALVELYEDGGAEVEPRQFLGVVARVRRDVYDFIGHGAERVNARIVAA